MSFLDAVFVVETACRGGGGSTLSQLFMATPVFGGETIRRHGSDALKKRLLPGIAGGTANFCMALTEPDAGSDTFATTTRAVHNGDGKYVVNGQKVWITAVPEADYILTIVRTTPPGEVDRRWKGLSLFLIDRDAPGVSYTPLDKVGTRCISSSAIYFDDVEVPEERLIGELDMGWRHLLDTLNTERLVTAAGCLATAELVLQIACDYAKERVVFGQRDRLSSRDPVPACRAQDADRGCTTAHLSRRPGSTTTRFPLEAAANMAKFLAAEVAYDACDRGDPDARRLRPLPGVPRRAALARCSSVPHGTRLERADPRLRRPARARSPAVVLMSPREHRRASRGPAVRSAGARV